MEKGRIRIDKGGKRHQCWDGIGSSVDASCIVDIQKNNITGRQTDRQKGIHQSKIEMSNCPCSQSENTESSQPSSNDHPKCAFGTQHDA